MWSYRLVGHSQWIFLHPKNVLCHVLILKYMYHYPCTYTKYVYTAAEAHYIQVQVDVFAYPKIIDLGRQQLDSFAHIGTYISRFYMYEGFGVS